MSKIYCYVDESGQHTHGDFFTVSVVIVKTIEMRDEGERMLLEVERATEKGSTKWTKTHHLKKARYLRTIATLTELKNCLFYSTYIDTRDYVGATVDAIARVLQQHVTNTDTHGIIVIVDGLDKQEEQQIAKRLKRAGVVYKKVRGAKDEGSAWIRLADAVAGFSWDVYKNKPYTQNIHADLPPGFFIQLSKKARVSGSSNPT